MTAPTCTLPDWLRARTRWQRLDDARQRDMCATGLYAGADVVLVEREAVSESGKTVHVLHAEPRREP